MMMQTKPGGEQRFVPAILPWILAAAAAVVYLFTFNSWISLNNLGNVAKSAGWLWGPDLYNPLYFLITYPFRWLPAQWMPVAFNLFSLVCAVLTLALLARSVAILPQDRTQEQRKREKNKLGIFSGPMAWIPPVLAVVVCGLQLTFWESATSGGNELLNVLLIAYVIRNLLEFRINGEDSCLFRAALVFGLGMANSWLIFSLFPAFVIALIWIRGMSFFNSRFLLRLFLCGVAGLLLYLVLPTIYTLSANPMVNFWQALKVNLAMDKNAFLQLAIHAPINVRLLLAIFSIMPIFIMGIRWASNFGDISHNGKLLATWVLHFVHAALLVACVWVAFDPLFSPAHLGFGFPGLYYLTALSVGYFAAYFLVVSKPYPDRMGRTTPIQHGMRNLSVAVVVLLLAVSVIGLLCRNFPQVRIANGPAIRHYASQLVEKIPARAVVLSDNAEKLYLAEAALAGGPKFKDYIFLNSESLSIPAYHGFLQKQYPHDWPTGMDITSTNQVSPRFLLSTVAKLAQTRPVYYLHPSFGYYFEYFDSRPRGMTLEMLPHSTNSLSGPPLSESEIADNENFWNAADSDLKRLEPFINPPPANTNSFSVQKILKKLYLPFRPNSVARTLGMFYSQARNFWGVQAQRAGKLDAAKKSFESAIALNPENIAAQNSLAFNADLQAGVQPVVKPLRSLEDELGKFRTWQDVLKMAGPFDDPTHCLGIAMMFTQGNLYREAAREFKRVHELAPESVLSGLWLARLYTLNRMPEKSLALVSEIRRQTNELQAAGIGKAELLQTEATALLADKETEKADELLETAIHENSDDPKVLGMVVRVSSMFGRYTNALAAADRQLELLPDDPSALFNKGFVTMQLGRYEQAAPLFTRILSLQPTNYNAQLYRAIAYVKSDHLDEAQQDFESLQKVFPDRNDVNGGLAEVAWRRNDTNTAIHYYQMCVTNVPPGSPQAKFYNQRLESLKTSPP
ncbi:MAG TPA: tetratricopeptide repeat protein [Verrucomicrobiae bacterium]|nr:tetratricopeptide repeat protein [Verrucomicrobiae bacterium]